MVTVMVVAFGAIAFDDATGAEPSAASTVTSASANQRVLIDLTSPRIQNISKPL
jgi:hypothetical protein